MKQILRLSFPVLWVSLVTAVGFTPLSVEACIAGWTDYIVVSEDTPDCFTVTESLEMSGPVILENHCAVDVTIEPLEGSCTNCLDTFVVASGGTGSLHVVGDYGENTYRWSMEGKGPGLSDEGTIVVTSVSTGGDCPGPLGCSATERANNTHWHVLTLMLLSLLVMRRRLSARMSKLE